MPAGISFAISALISPSAVLAGPSFLILRPRFATWLRMFLPAALLMTLYLAPVLDDYLLSPRGLLNAAPMGLSGAPAPAAESSASFWTALVPRAEVVKEGRDAVLGFLLLLPLVALGLFELVREKKARRLGLALLSLWLFSFIFGATHPTVPVHPFQGHLGHPARSRRRSQKTRRPRRAAHMEPAAPSSSPHPPRRARRRSRF